MAQLLGGFTAAEGTFGAYGDAKVRFRFAIGLGASDRATYDLFRTFLGVGNVTWAPRRKPHYDDEVTYAVQSVRELVEVVVPFMDEHLPRSYKREQYLEWREKLLEYWNTRARRGPRRCTIEDCGEPARAHGLCRPHLWEHRRQ